MSVDVDAVRAAVRAARKADVYSNSVLEDLDYEPMANALDPLVEAEGFDAVIDALAPHHTDLDIAEALFYLFWDNGENMLSVFSEEGIVEAALQLLIEFRGDHFTDTRGLPDWGWSALCLHDYEYEDHLTNEQAFRILLAVIDRAPWDDSILEMLGDMPLSNPNAHPEYRRRLQELVQSEPKIARAIELDAAYWAKSGEYRIMVDAKPYTPQEFLERSPDP